MSTAIYDTIGKDYARFRIPEPQLIQRLSEALGDAQSVINVGAGSGSYEPADRKVFAVEPSKEMLEQREKASALAVQACAEFLPFKDGAVDATLAILTLHHWSDPIRGLHEMARIARDRVVLLTWDPSHGGFWLTEDYFPDLLKIDVDIFPNIESLSQILGQPDVRVVPIPWDCSDGFLGAYWRRPESYLSEGVRGAISSFSKVDAVETRIQRLDEDLRSGAWEKKYGSLRRLTDLDLGYRILTFDVR